MKIKEVVYTCPIKGIDMHVKCTNNNLEKELLSGTLTNYTNDEYCYADLTLNSHGAIVIKKARTLFCAPKEDGKYKFSQYEAKETLIVYPPSIKTVIYE